MTTNDPKKSITMLEAARKQSIKPKSDEMAQYLAAGYGMTIKEAGMIKAEFEKDHQAWPLAEYRKACAMLEAFETTPVAIDTSPAWKRETLEG